MADYNNNPKIGYVTATEKKSETLSITKISFTAEDIAELQRNLVGKETKRVYCTLVNGISKADKPYAFFEVWSPEPQQNKNAQSYKGATPPKPAQVSEDLPF
jgi:hypothetical protein